MDCIFRKSVFSNCQFESCKIMNIRLNPFMFYYFYNLFSNSSKSLVVSFKDLSKKFKYASIIENI